LLDRDRLPLPAGTTIATGLDGHYPAVVYYAVLRLLLGHQPSISSGLPTLSASEPSRSLGVRR
jgi:hypothetical protein